VTPEERQALIEEIITAARNCAYHDHFASDDLRYELETEILIRYNL
jgi:hypothetical protein